MTSRQNQSFDDYAYDSDDSDLSFQDPDDLTYLSEMSSNDETDSDEDSTESESLACETDIRELLTQSAVNWVNVPPSFNPSKTIPQYKEPDINFNQSFRDNFTEMDLFLKLFPRSLITWITNCTNTRLKIRSEKKGIEIKPTDFHEIMIVIGCYLVMAFNRVPELQMYWSRHKSLRNETIASSISRDRFLLISSKLYFNEPKKPEGASKTYYMEEIVNCLKYTFQKSRSDSTYQAIDESMVKCQARTSLKQYMKNKPVDLGIKMWGRCDSDTGYCYDFNIYAGKETENLSGTLGERVVTTLCSTISDGADVVIIIDRFFTSVNLLKNLPHALVGTCMTNRKNVPKIIEKLKRGDSIAKSTDDGIICFKWQDTKEVLLMSNCHGNEIGNASRRQKDGTLKVFDCPEAIVFYNKMMGGVDKADQYSTIYEVDRKSQKWWKRVFHRLLMMAVSNSWILFQKLNGKKSPLIDYLIPLSDQILEVGKRETANQRNPGAGRPPKRKKFMYNVGHQPILVGTRRRCKHCANKKIQMRTIYLCNTCELPLCITCFEPYHK